MRLNLSGNDAFAPAGGYPFRLWEGGQTIAEGVISKRVASVSATVYAQRGTIDAHLALYEPPTTVTSNVPDADGALVVDLDPDDQTLILKAYQADAEGVGLTETTLTVDVPTNRARQSYVVRLWVDNITGRIADEEDRDADSSVDDEATLPTGAYVTEMGVS